MAKLSKCEIKVREEIVKKQNLLKALKFDKETIADRIIAVESEIKTLESLLTDN